MGDTFLDKTLQHIPLDPPGHIVLVHATCMSVTMLRSAQMTSKSNLDIGLPPTVSE